MRVWCYFGASGRICADSDFKTEDEAWRVMLGWPTRREVKAAQDRGDKVKLIAIGPISEREPPHCPTCECGIEPSGSATGDQ